MVLTGAHVITLRFIVLVYISLKKVDYSLVKFRFEKILNEMTLKNTYIYVCLRSSRIRNKQQKQKKLKKVKKHYRLANKNTTKKSKAMRYLIILFLVL